MTHQRKIYRWIYRVGEVPQFPKNPCSSRSCGYRRPRKRVTSIVLTVGMVDQYRGGAHHPRRGVSMRERSQTSCVGLAASRLTQCA